MAELIDRNGIIHPALVRLARSASLDASFGMRPEPFNSLLQSSWYKAGKTCKDMTGPPPSAEQMQLLRELEYVDAIDALVSPHIPYDGALLLGGHLTEVRKRLAGLIRQHQRSARFSKVWAIGSERPLWSDEDREALIALKHGLHLRQEWNPDGGPLPLDEIGMMRYVIQQTEIPANWDMALVRCPDIVMVGRGPIRHANSADSLEYWGETSGMTKGIFLIASDQPYLGYQVAAAERIFESDMIFHGTGPAADPGLPLAVFLDCLAKHFFEAFEASKKAKAPAA